jgi:hypothetical protein
LQPPIECELAQRNKLLQPGPADLFVHPQQRQRDGKVEGRPGLANVGRREVDQQPARRIGKPRVENGSPHAFSRFAQSAIREANDGKARGPGRAVGFDAHDIALDAEHRS